MFTKQELKALLIPLVIEQILTGLMGVADTLMVSNVGEAALSGVSLVDSVNMLVTYFFSAIAAQAVVYTLETCSSMPAMAIGTGLLTVAGQCIGRGREEQARAYTRRFVGYSRLILLGVGAVLSAAAPVIMDFTALSESGALLACELVWFTSVLKVIFWPGSFTLPNTLRAAGDVSYAMVVSTVSMWVFRVGLSWVLCRYTPVGLWGIWIAWCSDWLVRNIAFRLRFRGERWIAHRVLD